jgi:hypothetical protein
VVNGSIDTESFIRYQEIFGEGLSEQHVAAIAELFPNYVPEGLGAESGSEEE